MSPAPDNHDAAPQALESPKHHQKRFRFKRKRHERDDHDREKRYAHRHRDGKSDRHRRKRHRTEPERIDDPSAYDDSVSGLPPDTAFRESLFDAMGDDEGAAFWEGVYGHPIHTYTNTYQNNETGELEQMDDEEYAQYVRRKMWERSWEGIEAAKEEKRREREQEKQKVREEERTKSQTTPPHREPDYLFDLDIEESLRRGERRRDRKKWKSIWDEYLQRWSDLKALQESRRISENGEQIFLRNRIAWPVESGKRKDVNGDEVERFMKSCTEAIDSDETTSDTVLKFERVRWHPDKIQQRYSFMNIDESTMQGVTSVFQILDCMWNDRRNRT